MAAVGGVARVDDVDLGDEDVLEGAGLPAHLDRRCRRALQDGDALDGDVGVIDLDRVVVGVVEDVLDRGPRIVLQPVRLPVKRANLFVIRHLGRERFEVSGEVHGVERRGVDGHAVEDEGLLIFVADPAPHPQIILVGLVVAVVGIDVGLVDVLLTRKDAVSGSLDCRGGGIEGDRTFHVRAWSKINPVGTIAQHCMCNAGEPIYTSTSRSQLSRL